MSSRLPLIDPQLALLVKKAPEGDAWLHEVKIDDYRAAAIIERGPVRMYSRNSNDWTQRFQPIPHSLANLKVKSAYLDGEIAVLDSEGCLASKPRRKPSGGPGETP